MREYLKDYIAISLCMTLICLLMFGAPWIIIALL